MRMTLVPVVAGMLMFTTTLAQQPPDGGFSMYKENYLIFSSDGGSAGECDAQFQFGFKHQLGGEEIPMMNVDNNLFFVYTQRSFNDLCESSSPFRATNYLPGLVWIETIERNEDANVQLREWSAGFEHESNGLAGVQSRSWNRLFLEAIATNGTKPRDSLLEPMDRGVFKHLDEIALRFRIWDIISKSGNNQDIRDFQGSFETQLTYTTKGEQFALKIRRAPKFNSANTTFEITTRVIPLLRHIPALGPALFDLTDTKLAFFFQYFNGYGEELTEYSVKEEVFRFGIRFVE